jgi:hypothetical protein
MTMKEIDFLPQWYIESRRRQINMRRQYIALGAIFGAMMIFNAIATHSVSRATVELAQTELKRVQAESVSLEFAKIRDQVAQLQKKARSIERINSRIDVASVLAEMSYLIDERIVLRDVEFIAEKCIDKQEKKSNTTSAVRVAGNESKSSRGLPLGDVRFKIVIAGIAANAADVATLVCKLEDSPYFHLVYPSFSKNTKIRVSADNQRESLNSDTLSTEAGDQIQVAEFEISCYLANYNQVTVGG